MISRGVFQTCLIQWFYDSVTVFSVYWHESSYVQQHNLHSVSQGYTIYTHTQSMGWERYPSITGKGVAIDCWSRNVISKCVILLCLCGSRIVPDSFPPCILTHQIMPQTRDRLHCCGLKAWLFLLPSCGADRKDKCNNPTLTVFTWWL